MINIPVEMARKYHLFPLREEESGVVVLGTYRSLSDPELKEIGFFLGKKVEIEVCPKERVIAFLEEHYGLRESIGEIAASGDQTPKKGLVAEPGTSMAERLLEHMLEEAVRKRATDIHLEFRDTYGALRFRVDGVLISQENIPLALYPSVVSRIKVLSNLDIGEKRLPQDGQFTRVFEGVAYDIRVSILPGLYGEVAVLRLLSRNHEGMNLKDLGFDEKAIGRFKSVMGKGRGLVLVTGSTGSGKSTTAHALIRGIEREQVKIISVEDPIEYRFVDMVQIQVKPEIDFDFARALRSILRHDPEVILVGEIRDGETADIAMRASVTGHLVISTVHANSIATAVSRLQSLGVAPGLIADSTSIIVYQDLVRLSCPECGGDAEKVKGCVHCGKTGFRGRSAIYEMLEVTPKVASEIRAGTLTDEGVLGHLNEQHLPSIQKCFDSILEAKKTVETEYRRQL